MECRSSTSGSPTQLVSTQSVFSDIEQGVPADETPQEDLSQDSQIITALDSDSMQGDDVEDPELLNDIQDAFYEACQHLQNYNLTQDFQENEQAKILYQVVLAALPVGHDLRAAIQTNLASVLSNEFCNTGSVEAYSDAINSLNEALLLRPPGHPSRGLTLLNGANTYTEHFERFKDASSLDMAISLLEQALSAHPPGHHHHVTTIKTMRSALKSHPEDWATLPEIRSQVLALDRYLLELHPPGHSEHREYLSRLGGSLESAFRATGDLFFTEESVALLRSAFESLSPQDPDYARHLSNYASAVMTRCQNITDPDALSEAVDMLREVLRLSNPNQETHVIYIQNLANVIGTRWYQNRNPDDMTEMLSLRREMLRLCPPGSKYHCTALVRLARDLKRHSKTNDDPSVLAESIRLLRQASQLHQDRSDRIEVLSALANALVCRDESTYDPGAVPEIYELNVEILHLLPPGHTDRASPLVNLANLLSAHSDQFSDGKMRAIGMYEEALRILGPESPDRFMAISNLGKALCILKGPIPGHEDPQRDAIQVLREGLKACPMSHPARVGLLDNLAMILSGHCRNEPANPDTLEEAINLYEQKLELLPLEDPDRQATYHWLAISLLVPSPHFSYERALAYIFDGITDGQSSARRRLKMAKLSLLNLEYATLARYLNHDDDTLFYSQEVLSLYQQIANLLPQAAHFSLDYSSRLHELSGLEGITRNAAGRAVDLSRPELAVELFEAGKGIFWQQALRIRSPALKNISEDNRDTLTELFAKLERSDVGFSSKMNKSEVERQVEERRLLGAQIDQLIEKIRESPEHEFFMRPQPFQELYQATEHGGIVVLLLSTLLTNYAVILRPESQEAITVILSSNVTDNLEHLANRAQASGLRFGSGETQRMALERLGMHTSPSGKNKHKSEKVMDRLPDGVIEQYDTLEHIWNGIVWPVLEALELPKSTGRSRPRLHWCSTGAFTFLPIHAAGMYQTDDPVCISDYVVSSYTPSLSSLINARKGWSPVSCDSLKALLIAEPAVPGMDPLFTVEEEVGTVACLLDSVSATVSNDLEGSTGAGVVIEKLPETHILHLACHGQQHDNPLQSRFVLNGGNLTIADLMKVHLPNAVLAFLSACETAKGDSEQPDQAVHLAASMLFCGFRSIIATMWSMHDIDGPEVTQWFYEKLLEKDQIDLDDIPYALDEAISRLRATGASPSRWATFIHIGA